MKMTHEQQIAVLVCLYLQRSGSSNISNIVEGLMILESDLINVVTNLVSTRILMCTSADEVELLGDPTIGDILMSFETPTKIRGFSVEARALRTFISNTNNALKPMLKRKISNINKELIANEVSMRDKASGIEN